MAVLIDARNPRSIAAVTLAVRATGWARIETHDGQPFHGIPSRTEPGVIHIADTQTCTCRDHKFRDVACAHILAARIREEQVQAKAALRTRTPQPAAAPKVSRYAAVWGDEDR